MQTINDIIERNVFLIPLTLSKVILRCLVRKLPLLTMIRDLNVQKSNFTHILTTAIIEYNDRRIAILRKR